MPVVVMTNLKYIVKMFSFSNNIVTFKVLSTGLVPRQSPLLIFTDVNRATNIYRFNVVCNWRYMSTATKIIIIKRTQTGEKKNGEKIILLLATRQHRETARDENQWSNIFHQIVLVFIVRSNPYILQLKAYHRAKEVSPRSALDAGHIRLLIVFL